MLKQALLTTTSARLARRITTKNLRVGHVRPIPVKLFWSEPHGAIAKVKELLSSWDDIGRVIEEDDEVGDRLLWSH